MKTVYANENEIINDIIERAGIKTIRINDEVHWEYNGIRVSRPERGYWFNNWQEYIRQSFGIEVEILKEK